VIAMPNWMADVFERSLRSPACADGTHGDCPHMCGYGGGLNPRRLRLESGMVLCKCECHSSCPVTGKTTAVPEEAWRESCSCPGAEGERVRQDQADSRSRGYIEALDAARARAAGMSREEIRDVYEAELHSRGLELPGEPVMDACAEAIASYCGRGAGLAGRSLAGLAKLLGGMSRPPR
jgi:hypothetical protein